MVSSTVLAETLTCGSQFFIISVSSQVCCYSRVLGSSCLGSPSFFNALMVFWIFLVMLRFNMWSPIVTIEMCCAASFFQNMYLYVLLFHCWRCGVGLPFVFFSSGLYLFRVSRNFCLFVLALQLLRGGTSHKCRIWTFGFIWSCLYDLPIF